MTTLYRPEYLYVDQAFTLDAGLLVDDTGHIAAIGLADSLGADEVIQLPGKAILPGFVNAHSHSFQRLIRGMAESYATSGRDFWSWRGTMYHAAAKLSLEDIYDVARMAFLEMLMSGTTTVGEFHYLHNAPDGAAYSDPNAAASQIIAAARSVGIRIVLLRSAYMRAGFGMPADPGQSRFYETREAFLDSMQALIAENRSRSNTTVHLGVAPHSMRAVPLKDILEIAGFATSNDLPLHMHISEQVAENEACLQEYGATPLSVLAAEKVLNNRFTAVHAIHITAEEAGSLAAAGAGICSCPTTERNLGDGILAADEMMRIGIPLCFGSDSQAQIDPLEDARELDYHLRLEKQQRAILDRIDDQSMASRLFDCATLYGSRSLGLPAGGIKPGAPADWFTVDVNDISIAGHDRSSLLPLIVFGLQRGAIKDVVVQGKFVLKDGRHPLQADIVGRYTELHQKVWSGREAVSKAKI